MDQEATNSVLLEAALAGDLDGVRSAIAGGADVNTVENGWTSLQTAAAYGHTEMVTLLLDRGADVNASGEFRATALSAASGGGHTEIMALLLDRGADVNAQTRATGSALMWAAENSEIESVRLLLDRNADVNARNTAGKTALMKAAVDPHDWPSKSMSIVGLLLDRGADWSAEDEHGETALVMANRRGKAETAGILRAHEQAHALRVALDAERSTGANPQTVTSEPVVDKHEPPRQWPEPFTGPDDTSPTVRAPAEQRAVRRRL